MGVLYDTHCLPFGQLDFVQFSPYEPFYRWINWLGVLSNLLLYSVLADQKPYCGPAVEFSNLFCMNGMGLMGATNTKK